MSKTDSIITFSCEKSSPKSLHVVSQDAPDFDADSNEQQLVMRVDKVGLSANNKFYMAFGEQSGFHFFKCYPLGSNARIVPTALEKTEPDTTAVDVSGLVNMPAWGLATVIQSSSKDVPVGTKFRAMLPMGTKVYIDGFKVQDNGDVMIDRPETNPAHNLFVKLDPNSIQVADDPNNKTEQEMADLALVSFPGIITGFGLYHTLRMANFYRPKSSSTKKAGVIFTSASSKVALAAAVYFKHKLDASLEEQPKLVGYTSPSNVDFVKKTGLYDEVLVYGTPIEDQKDDDISYVLIDIAGRSDPFQQNKAKIVKGFVVGNSNDVKDKKGSTMSQMSMTATLKLMMTFAGVSSYWRSFLNPTLELFLIMDSTVALKKEWGDKGFEGKTEEATRFFCHQAKDWIQVKRHETIKAVEEGCTSIITGSVPPSKAILLNIGKAVQGLVTN